LFLLTVAFIFNPSCRTEYEEHISSSGCFEWCLSVTIGNACNTPPNQWDYLNNS